jgi:hypothetical protein
MIAHTISDSLIMCQPVHTIKNCTYIQYCEKLAHTVSNLYVLSVTGIQYEQLAHTSTVSIDI